MITAQQAQEKLSEVIALSKEGTVKWVKETCVFIEANIEAAINNGKDSVFVTVVTLRPTTKVHVEDELSQLYALTSELRNAGYTVDYTNSKPGSYNMTISWSANKETMVCR